MGTAGFIRKLVERGLSHEQALIAAEVYEAECEAGVEKKREQAAERQRRRRANNAVSHNVTSVTRDNCDSPNKETPPTPPKEIKPQDPPYSPPRSKRAEPEITLQSELDGMTAKRFATHCSERGRRLSTPMAENIAAELKKYREAGGNPVEAISQAIKRGWVTFEASWLSAPEKSEKPTANAADVQSILDPSQWSEDRWKGVLDDCRARSDWPEIYGPPPWAEGCLVPRHLWREGDRKRFKVAA